MLSPDGEIRRDEGCIDYAGQFVMIYPCHGMKGNQEWVYGLVRLLQLIIAISTHFTNVHLTKPFSVQFYRGQLITTMLVGWLVVCPSVRMCQLVAVCDSS